jgi:hypothetical protein
MSKLWLKPEPDNVSQSDLRRIQEEKAALGTLPEIPTPPEKPAPRISEPVRKVTPVENRTPPEKATEPLRNEPVGISGGVVLDAKAAHLQIPYEVWNNEFRKHKAQQRVILEELFRAAQGWHSNECVISIGKLAKHCRMEATQVREHLKRLYVDGAVERLGDVTGGSDKDARGIRFRINLPRMPPPEIRTPAENRPPRKSEANKEKNIKKDSKSVVCDLCKESPGFVYPSGVIGQGPVKTCPHREGK